MLFREALVKTGLESGHHILVHSSFRNIRKAFGNSNLDNVTDTLKDVITMEGSVIMPAFTYCFKKSSGEFEVFDRDSSASKVGAVSEVFRKSEGVIRTSSPTHSFSLWGKITEEITTENNPESPLGKGSPLDWLACRENSYILMLGTGFDSFTLGHYLEITAPVPWADISPWDYLGVQKTGVSTEGEKRLKEVPGCSKSFVNFEKHLLNSGLIQLQNIGGLNIYYMSVREITDKGKRYFRENPQKLLCEYGTCKACDSRRKAAGLFYNQP